MSEEWSESRVNTKNGDTSNPGFLSIPHKSFVKLNVIAFFRNISLLYMVDFCIVSIYDRSSKVVDMAFKNE